MTAISIYLLVSACLLVPFGIGWFINCVTAHRMDQQYAEFYRKYAVRKHAEVVYYAQEIMRSGNSCIYHITLQFSDDDDRTYRASLRTNHHSAKKYAKVKEDDFLCLYDAIRAELLSLEYIDSKAPEKWRVRLHGIPLVVLPAEENFVQTGRMDRLMPIIFILAVFAGVGILCVAFLLIQLTFC